MAKTELQKAWIKGVGKVIKEINDLEFALEDLQDIVTEAGTKMQLWAGDVDITLKAATLMHRLKNLSKNLGIDPYIRKAPKSGSVEEDKTE